MCPKPALRWVHGFLGVNWIINGVWMVCAPAHWFAAMPQATETGPLNEHFVRDYGSVFVLIGMIILWQLAHGSYGRQTHAWILLFFVLHALMHVWDISAGRLGHHHWTSGFLLVMLPVVVLAALLHPRAWEKQHK
jgi:uncharacterized protein YjeT (DUF2065 family)